MFSIRFLKAMPDATRYMALSALFKWLALFALVVLASVMSGAICALLDGTAPLSDMSAPASAVASVLAFYLFRVLAENFGAKAGTLARNRFMQSVFDNAVRLESDCGRVMDSSEVSQLMGEGSEQLRPYFSSYLPQFLFSLMAPLTLFAVALPRCAPAAVIMLACVVLMPVSIMVFMKRAQKFMGSYWGSYVDLSASFLDALRALTTFKVFSADTWAQERLDAEAKDFRKITMKLLRVQLTSVTFMDLFSYGGMAAGATVVALWLLGGSLALDAALFVTLLIPGFFLPMRSFGTQFHTGMNANEIIGRYFALLDTPGHVRGDKETDHATPSIECEGASVRYGDDSQALHDISFEIEPVTFTGITGESGAGKTTLMRALSGQFLDYHGSIRLCGVELREISAESLHKTVTIVSHESHIFKGTVRSNLLLGKPDANDYEMWEALRRAHVDDFVIALGGLGSELTEGGANLSGGQRQRICFARAILRDTPIYLFDEAASNVDAESEKKLLSVIQELSMGKTVLFATHRLSSLTQTDNILVFDNGTVAEQGTHFSLVRTQDGVYRKLWDKNALLEDIARAADSTVLDEEYEPSEVEKILDSLPRAASQMMYAALMARDALKYKRQVEKDAYDPVTMGHPSWIPLPESYRSEEGQSDNAESGAFADAGAGVEESSGTRTPVWQTVRGLLHLTKPMHGQTARAVCLGALSNVAVIALAAFAAAGISAVEGAGDAWLPLAVAVAGACVCGIVRGPLHYGERLGTHSQTFLTLELIRSSVFEKMRELAPAKLESRDSGELIALLTSDVEMLEGFYSRTIAPVLAALFSCICALGALALLSPTLVPLALAGYAVGGVLIPVATARITRETARDIRSFSANMTTFLLDALHGMGDLLQFGRAEEYASEMKEHMETLKAGARDLSRVSSLLAPGPFAIALLVGIAAVVVLGGQGALTGEQATCALVAIFVFIASFEPVIAVSKLGFSLSRTLASAERVLNILDETPATRELDAGASLDTFTGATMEGVTFAYPGSRQAALRIPELSAEPGMLLRISGKSGAGKSTLLKLLMRFWDADNGTISISDRDIRTVSTTTLRGIESYMTQDTYLFQGSLRDNITFGDSDITDEHLVEVIEQVRLTDVLARLPQGLDTPVGGNGGRGILSAGERQRVGLARALVHDAQFLLLDEPTSNLDSLNEAAVLYALAQGTIDKTVVVVSHRPAVAALADASYIVHKPGEKTGVV